MTTVAGTLFGEVQAADETLEAIQEHLGSVVWEGDYRHVVDVVEEDLRRARAHLARVGGGAVRVGTRQLGAGASRRPLVYPPFARRARGEAAPRARRKGRAQPDCERLPVRVRTQTGTRSGRHVVQWVRQWASTRLPACLRQAQARLPAQAGRGGQAGHWNRKDTENAIVLAFAGVLLALLACLLRP